MSNLRPGKGFMGDATEESINFLAGTFEELRTVFAREGYEMSADELIDAGQQADLLKALKEEYEWKTEKDSFGTKAYKLLDWGNGAYRVTLALTTRGSLKVDVRSWFVPGE